MRDGAARRRVVDFLDVRVVACARGYLFAGADDGFGTEVIAPVEAARRVIFGEDSLDGWKLTCARLELIDRPA